MIAGLVQRVVILITQHWIEVSYTLHRYPQPYRVDDATPRVRNGTIRERTPEAPQYVYPENSGF